MDEGALPGAPPRPLFTSFVTCFQDGKTRCTTGSVVSSLYHLKDSENDNRDAGFFVFPDLSVRQEGSYRLKLSLFEVVGCVPTHHHLSSSLSLHIHPSPFLSSNVPALFVLFHIRHKTHIFDLNKRRSVSLFEIRTLPFRSTRGSISFHCFVFFIPCPPSHFLMILKLMIFSRSNVYHCKSIFSAPFYVYTAKKFPGMEGLELHTS